MEMRVRMAAGRRRLRMEIGSLGKFEERENEDADEEGDG